MKRLLMCLLPVLLLLSACSGSNGENSADEKQLTYLYNFTSSTIDPHLDVNNVAVRAGITETLVKLNEDLSLEPWLATEWENVDEYTWRFTIREGVTFQDGTAMDAEAVKASFERAIAVSDSVKASLKIAAIEVDGNDVIFTTTEPLASFASELTHPHTSIAKVDDEEQLSSAPIGTGPFKVEQFTSEVKVELAQYIDYWQGEPKLDRVTFAFNTDANARVMSVLSGEADIAYYVPTDLIPSLEENADVVVDTTSSLRTHYLTYNITGAYTADENVRRALDLLNNREAIVTDIMGGNGVVANSAFPASYSFSSDREPTSFNVEAAKSLLQEVGYEEVDGVMTKDGEALTLELITYQSRAELPLIAQMLQANAKEIGITINIKTVDNIDEYLSSKDDWDLATYSNVTAPRGDAGYFMNVAYLAGGSLNVGGINDATMNELIAKLNTTFVQSERDSIAKQIEEIAVGHVYNSYLVHPTITVAMNKRVIGYEASMNENYMITYDLDVE